MLKYLTKGDSNPNGKPRVYFCCHPAEQALFLKPIAKDVLATQNCTIWYLESPNSERDETFWGHLSQMQLLVMPVTTSLLHGDNVALDEFRFATEHHIPVLPIMQERGLVESFNHVCGNLQFLDKLATDDTAIRYEDKLEAYLSDVLIGDDLAQKVREAFDAYVFLSYRKRDRHHAQELMHLIHENDFAQDIAIWYDEFLVLGEDFNETIRLALEKSHLFVMAVTPNLVCEPNYIQSTEYPLAKKKCKPILPIELISTDRTALEEQYADIPNCTDGHNADALSNVLLSNLRQLALRKKRNNPEHMYLMGLAYLSGIDVEVDRPRALSLIKSAAEKGFVEAIKKLAQMYRDGIGVAEDPFEQAAWQTKLLKKREEAYTTEKTADTFTLYVRELVGIAQDWEKLNMRKDAAQLYETAVALCQAPAKDCDPNKYFSAYLFSLRGCSEIFIQDKAYEKAESYLDRAAIELKRCEGTGVAVLSSELKRTLGHLYRSLGKYSEAEECYRSMIDLYRSQEQEFGKSYADRNTAVAFWEIAKNQELQGKNAEACASYHNALVLLRPILSNEGYQLAALQDLVIISRSLAMLEEQASHYDAATDILNASILQIQEVPEWENRSEIAYYVWVLMVSLGELYNRVLDWDHATETYVAARKIRQLLRAEPATIQTLWENHIRQSRKADSYAAEGNNIGAKAAYLQSLKYAQLLEEKECSFHSSYGVWTELEKLVNFLAETNDSDFLQHMLHAIGIVGALAVESNSSPMYDRMAQLYIQTANYYYQAGDLQNAFKFYKSAKLVSEKRLAITTTYICVECLADANLGIGLIMNSKEFLESAHAMWSILCEQVSRSHPDATEQLRRYQKRRAFAAQCLHSFEQRAPGNC